VPLPPFAERVLESIAWRLRGGPSVAVTKVEQEKAELGSRAQGLEGRVRELEAQVAALRGEADGLRNLLAKVRVPAILVSTMPKSGTYFISKTMSQGLQIPERIIANQYFPYDRIRFFEMKKLVDDGGVTQDHFDAHPYNVTMLGHYFDRIVIQVRDPRQATLSWVHFVDDFNISEETYKFIYPVLPKGFFEQPLERRLDWAIERWLPLLIEWTRSWVDAAAQGPLKVKITRFEDMIVDENAFFDEMLEFYGVPQGRFVRPAIARDSATHFRKGETDEWRTVFNRAQAEAARRHIPSDLAERFGWSLD
jgi:hypothetical protein